MSVLHTPSYYDTPNKVFQGFICENYFSSSCDPVRRNLGYLYYHNRRTGRPTLYGETMPDSTAVGPFHNYDAATTMDVVSYADEYLPSEAETLLELYGREVVGRYATAPNLIKYVQYRTSASIDLSSTPRVTYAIRLIGDQDLIVNDAHWKAIMMGGTFNTSSYSPIYDTSVYLSSRFVCDFGYDAKKAKEVKKAGAVLDFDSIKVSYLYNNYSIDYQNFAADTHERLLPNFNLMGLVYKAGPAKGDPGVATVIDPSTYLPIPLYKYIAYEHTTYDTLFSSTQTSTSGFIRNVPPRYTTSKWSKGARSSDASLPYYYDPYYYVNKFLTSSFATTNSELNEEEKQYVHSANKIVYFTSSSVKDLQSAEFTDGLDRDTHGAFNYFPMVVQIKIPTIADSIGGDSTGDKKAYSNILANDELQEEVLSYINGTFTANAQAGGVIENMPFYRRKLEYDIRQIGKYYDYDLDGIPDEAYPTSKALISYDRNLSVPSFDVPTMLANIANRNVASENSLVLSNDAAQIVRMRNTNGTYRYSKSYPALRALEETMKKMKTNLLQNFDPNEGVLTAPNNYYDILKRIDQNQNSTHSNRTSNELFGYRIVKKAGNPVGDSRTTELLQTFMIFNNGVDTDLTFDGESMIINDTQVKYGHDYTYDIYAYYLVPGFRYRYNDIRLSNHIGTIETERDSEGLIQPGGGIGSEIECIEFRDPVTNVAVSQLLNDESNLKIHSRFPTNDGEDYFTNDSKYTYFAWNGTESVSATIAGLGGYMAMKPRNIQAFIFDIFYKIYIIGNDSYREKYSRAFNYDFQNIRGITTEEEFLNVCSRAVGGQLIVYRNVDGESSSDRTDFEENTYTVRSDVAGGFVTETPLEDLTFRAGVSNGLLWEIELFFAALEYGAGNAVDFMLAEYRAFCRDNPVYYMPESYTRPTDTYSFGSSFFVGADSGISESTEATIMDNIMAKYFTKLTWGATCDMVPAAGSTSAASTSATNAQIKSQFKYLSDFNLQIEPTLKMVQVPVTTKTVRILDHPPVACDVMPYFKKDDSQTIGFYVNKDAFTIFTNDYDEYDTKVNTFPTPVSQYELDIQTSYVNSNDLITSEYIKKESRSPIESVLVYRLSHKPTSLVEFDENIVATKRLNYQDDGSYSFSNCFYEERIVTNKKMYYFFKFINKNGIVGHTSQIHELTLVNDGGYKYLDVNTFSENEIVPKDEKIISTEFKKLMQIKLQPSQTILDYKDVNFAGDAHTEKEKIDVGTSDAIWNKKFKFRITSKKTGKKLDLNIKYKLRK